MGEEVDIRRPLHCDHGSHIRVGARTFINFGLMALDVATITIADDAVVGAGAVVTQDVAPGTVVVGNPARVARSVHDE